MLNAARVTRTGASRLVYNRNRFGALHREETAPHTYNMAADEMNKLLDFLDRRLNQSDEKTQKRLDTLETPSQGMLQTIHTDCTQLKSTVTHDHKRLDTLETVATTLSRDVGELKVNASRTSHHTSHSARDAMYDPHWNEDTHADTVNFDGMAGYVFVKPVQSSETVTAESLRNTLNTELPITPHPSVNGAFRVIVSESRGREGVLAVSSFLSRVPRTLTQRLIISREKTRLTILRGRCMKSINNVVKHVIATTPALAGLKTHVGSNNSSLFLSYADRKDALDYRNKNAPAFIYPVWQHVPYEPTMNNGRGGYDFFSCTNLDHNTILNTIQAVLPTPSDTQMPNASPARTRDRDHSDNVGRNTRQNTGQMSGAGTSA